MLPPDERKLEEIIGDLQSEWGVPQSPQEYRITIKVAEDREAGRPNHGTVVEEVKEDPPNGDSGGKPRREKAPAAPRIGAAPSAEREQAPPVRKKRRRRRGRGRGGKSGG